MNIKRILPVLLVFSSLACNYVMRAFNDPASADSIPTPAYIPPECGILPLGTVPPATALALPTPVLQANPEIGLELQVQVFDEVVSTVENVYVYPDFNGIDWEEITDGTREKITLGLTTQDFYAAIQSMITELGDEHSSFESPVEVAASEAELAGTEEFVGIGALILPLVDKDRVSLISIYPNSPAEQAGLMPHDSILAVDGIPIVQEGEARTNLVRGPQCSAVLLTVQSPGEATRTVMLVRQRIQSSLLIRTALLPTSDGSRLGYIFLPTFFDETIPEQVAQALETFGELDGLILDNRLNGGGSSSVVEPILSYFVSGTLGQYAGRQETRSLAVEADPIRNSQTVPLVVLVGEDTVSYGEIFSGVLKDTGRAQVVGEATLGNVEILHGYDLDDGSRLWIAEETFVPANSSQNWELTGIVPDVIAYADWDTFTFETDPSIAAAIQLLGH